MKSLVNKILLVLVIFNISLSASGISLVSAATIISEDYYDKNGDPVVDINSDARGTGQGFDIDTTSGNDNAFDLKQPSIDDFDYEKDYAIEYAGGKVEEIFVNYIDSEIPCFKNIYESTKYLSGITYDLSDSTLLNFIDTVADDELVNNFREMAERTPWLAKEIQNFDDTFNYFAEKLSGAKEAIKDLWKKWNDNINPEKDDGEQEDDKPQKGKDKTKEDATNNRKPGNDPAVKKPNIYFYGFDEELTVTFESPRYLLDTIPTYTDNWKVTASPDGTLVDENGNSYRYLFYEVSTQKFYYQTECGFALPAERRVECFNELLDGYGFTSEEKEDFIEFWCEELELEVDYIMYPQYTETIDKAYPMSVSTSPDTYIRIWFVFKEDAGQGYVEEEVVPFERVGKTMFEWGGMIF